MKSRSHLSVDECQRKLQDFYEAVQNAVAKARRGNKSNGDTSAHTDFNEEWNSERWQGEHLPVSLELISKRFTEEKRAAIEFQCPQSRTCETSPRYLLLMAGFSIEQLVLSIAFHYRYADEHEQSLAGIVPFIGEDAWNDVEGDLKASLPRVIGEPHATAMSRLVNEAVEVTPGDPAMVFKCVLQWIRRNPDAAIALDVTGGQKPMDTGGTYAAMYLGARAYYLDFDRYDVANRRPYPDTLKYMPLALPSAVFSHDARKAVVELFHHRRFQAAYDRLVQLSNEMNSADVRRYFEPVDKGDGPSDKDDVRQAVIAVDECKSWMSGNYCHPSMADHRLHSTFCAVETDKPNSCAIDTKEPKSILTSMLTTFGGKTPDKSYDLLCYLQDEYWRLRTMLYLGGEANDDRHCADLQDASDMIREVVVGSCALAEVAVDAVFYHPLAEVEIIDIKQVRLEFGDSPPNDDEIQKQLALLKEHHDELAAAIKNMALPRHRFPPSSTGPKTKLLRGSETKFRVYIPTKEVVKSLKADKDVSQAFQNALREAKKVGPNDKRLEIEATVQITKTQLFQIDNDTWERQWGDFGKNDESNHNNWMHNRNAIAHMRAPATDAQLAIAREAIETYLPRFLGVLTVLCGDNPVLPITDDAAWDAGSRAIESPRGPWHQPDKNESQLRKWLRLPADIRK